MNPTLPSKSLKQFYWENEEVQKGLEGNYNNWKAYIKGQKLKKQNNANKKGATLPKKGATLPKKGTTLPKKGTKSKNKSKKGLQAVKAQASLESPAVKSSEMLDCQGFPCP